MNERTKAIICNPKHILKCQTEDDSYMTNWFLVISVIRLLFIILLPDFHWSYVLKISFLDLISAL